VPNVCFIQALGNARGHTLTQSQEILASFGEEVVDRLKQRARASDVARDDVFGTYVVMAHTGTASPQLTEEVRATLKMLAESTDLKRADWAKNALQKLEDKGE
jgi:hypothetical protein